MNLVLTLIVCAAVLAVVAVLWISAATRIAQTVNALVPERRHDSDCAGCCSTCQSCTHNRSCESDVASS